MIGTPATDARQPVSALPRLLALAYGLVCYLSFLGTFLYAIGFVGNLVVPKSIDSGPQVALAEALAVDLLLLGLFGVGWLVALISTFLIDHFDLFGLRQVFLFATGRPYSPPPFRTPSLYRVVRHPIMLGFVIAFWATPVMTWGHLLFAAMTTAYILVGISLEERDLRAVHGGAYENYRQQVSVIVPWIGKGSKP